MPPFPAILAFAVKVGTHSHHVEVAATVGAGQAVVNTLGGRNRLVFHPTVFLLAVIRLTTAEAHSFVHKEFPDLSMRVLFFVSLEASVRTTFDSLDGSRSLLDDGDRSGTRPFLQG